MPFQPSRRLPPVLASVLAAAGLVLGVVGCSHITPLGPGPTPVAVPPPRHLGSPIIVQVMRSHPPTATGGCPAGWVAVSLPPGAPVMPCYRPAGTAVTITSAGVSSVSMYRPSPPPGQSAQSAQPTQYAFWVALPAADVAAVTAVMTHAADAGDAVGVSVAGKLWQAPQIRKPFEPPGRLLQIALFSRSLALELHRILVPSG
jgi:hypothetical protein